MNTITRFILAPLLIVPTLVIAQAPVAHFSATDKAICGNTYSENFTDLSTNNPTHWKWYFPGAIPDTSTLKNPTNITYKGYRCYPVKLVVSNNNGSDSLTDSNYICLYSPPTFVVKGSLNSCMGSETQDTVIVNGGDSIFYLKVQPVITTTYRFRVHNGPCYLDTTLTIHVDSVPHFVFRGNTSVCVGDSTIVYALTGKPYSNYGYKYLWSTGSTADSIIVYGKVPGTYVYYVTVTHDGCSTDSAQITIKVQDCTGIRNYDDPLGEVEVYPNPSNGIFQLEIKNYELSEGIPLGGIRNWEYTFSPNAL